MRGGDLRWDEFKDLFIDVDTFIYTYCNEGRKCNDLIKYKK